MTRTIVALLMAPLLTCGALVFAGAATEETATDTATVSSGAGACEKVLVGGLYTWCKNWLETPTASELGITQFNEAPTLAALVGSGELPPVEERLPEDPLVIATYDEVGEYGGTLRVARTGPGDYGDLLRGAKGWLFRADPSTSKVLPHLAKGWEISSDLRSLTIQLREGVKWSDGVPFTADDIMFLYTYGFADPDVQDSWRRGWVFDGELSRFEKIDDYTVRINFPRPVSPVIVKSNLNWFRSRQEFLFTAAHHMKRFHKAFNPNVEAFAKEEGYENWVQLWNAAVEIQPRQRYTQPETGPWVMESRDSAGKNMVRNPYFWAVDQEGNQLPYIDGFHAEFFSDPQVAILSMMQGTIDIGGRLMNPADFPLYKENEGIGGYSVREWQDTKTARVTYAFNLNHDDPVKGPIFLDKRFRQAMSLAMNRDEINEFAFQGLAIPQQFTVDSGAEFYDPAWARAYADYDPDRAMQLLEEMGIGDRDGDGWRDAPGGEQFVIDMNVRTDSVLGTMGFSTSELVRDYWQEVGVKVNYKQISDELNQQLTNSNQLDLVVWVAGSYLPTRLAPQRFGTGSSGYAVRWNDWLDHETWIAAGRQGEEPPPGQEPPPEWKRYMQDRIDWNSAASDAEFNRLGREVFAQHADLLPVIGTVAKVLRPIIINDRVRNVPDTLPFAFETLLWTQPTPMQWFIRE